LVKVETKVDTDNVEMAVGMNNKVDKVSKEVNLINVMINSVAGVIGPKLKENDPDNDYQDITSFIRGQDKF
jgi:hypothetical protein